MKELDDYLNARSALMNYFGYIDNISTGIIRDYRMLYWRVVTEDNVDHLISSFNAIDLVYPMADQFNHRVIVVNRKNTYTMIIVKTNSDIYIEIYSNDREVKEKKNEV